MVPTSIPGWVSRYSEALNAFGEADKRSWANPNDDALETARREAAGDVFAIETAMSSEIILMLRKADQRSGMCLRRLLTDIVGDVIDGKVDELRTDVRDLAEAVAALEVIHQQRVVRA